MTALLNTSDCVQTRALNKLYRTGMAAVQRLMCLDRLALHARTQQLGTFNALKAGASHTVALVVVTMSVVCCVCAVARSHTASSSG